MYRRNTIVEGLLVLLHICWVNGQTQRSQSSSWTQSWGGGGFQDSMTSFSTNTFTFGMNAGTSDIDETIALSPPSPSPSPQQPQQTYYQVNPSMCSQGNTVICVSQQTDQHPCDVAMQSYQSYSNTLCLQYNCNDPLKVGDIVQYDLACQAVFYDPITHVAVDPHTFQDPCASCQQNSMFLGEQAANAKKVCCQGKEFENECMASCQGMGVHCTQGPCQQNQVDPRDCVKVCFLQEDYDPYCCKGANKKMYQYSNFCAANCYYNASDISICNHMPSDGVCSSPEPVEEEQSKPPPTMYQSSPSSSPTMMVSFQDFIGSIEGLNLNLQAGGSVSASASASASGGAQTSTAFSIGGK
eukprot:TRINITY_DN4704_c0_g1_i2.p1 TRINITY_DN4704_c0_g1~~TRINITY_DN4704_c0_g1_i2.p1  ORF type:complete len:355 (-),score=33.73 TRINITY_DN4704_c0_g1_i2:191-1255(-)